MHRGAPIRVTELHRDIAPAIGRSGAGVGASPEHEVCLCSPRESALREFHDAVDDGAVFVVDLLDVEVDAEPADDAHEPFH